MPNPRHTDCEPPTPADSQRVAYQTALSVYTDAIHHADRMEGLQAGEPFERQDPEVWQLQESAWRALDRARAALIATAPDQPTSWWPGGWIAVSPNWPHGLRGLPKQVAPTSAWRTQDEARADRPDFIPAHDWSVSWTPTARNEFHEIPLDAVFWATSETSDS